MTREIPLTRGRVALVDDSDYEWLSQWKWCMGGAKGAYAIRAIWLGSGKQRMVKMHRVIMDAPPDMMVDHINHDTLDNRKANLRLCSAAENSRNAAKKTTKTSRYKGVHWYKAYSKWRAMISLNRKPKHLGYFGCENDAARAYNVAAVDLFGEFAFLNEIEE